MNDRADRADSVGFGKRGVVVKSGVSHWLIERLFRGTEGRNRLARHLGEDVVEVTRVLSDHTVSFNPNETIGRKLFAVGDWERETTQNVLDFLLSEDLLEADRVLLELGANIGTQSLYLMLSELFERAVVVEPAPNNVALLTRNIRQNGFEDRVNVVACAVADTDGELDLYLDRHNQGAHSVVAANRRESITVRSLTIESILRSVDVAPSEIGFVWMDIEGAELVALSQCFDVLKSPPMFVEFSPVLLGKKNAEQFKHLVVERYTDVMLVPRKSAWQRLASTEIPLDIEQTNLLLFNSQSS